MNTRPACDICGHTPTTNTICGNLCNQTDCYATAWDQTFAVNA